MRRKSILGGNPVAMVAAPMQEILSERASVEREFDKELVWLVGTKGWHYAQRVANQIQTEFACTPKDPDWQVYTTIQYALNQLFERIRLRAKQADASSGQSILAEMKEDYDSRRRNESTSTTGTSRRRRKPSA